MTVLTAPELEPTPPAEPTVAAPEPQERPPSPPPPDTPAQRSTFSAPLALSALLSTEAAAFLVAGLFKGLEPRLAAIAAALLGVGVVAYSQRSRSGWLQLVAVLPLSALLGAVLVVPDANGLGTANLPGLIGEAVHNGGFAQAPLAFDPGWRFLLVVVIALLGAGTLSAAAGFARPRLAAVVPMPIAMLAEVVQPKDTEVLGTAVAAVLIVAGLALSFNAELDAQGVVSSGSFQTRRLMRTAALALALVAAIVPLSRLDVLFPHQDRHNVTPPQRPQMPPPEADRRLFTYSVQGDRKVPLRIGTLDIYDKNLQAWLLPPYDDSRFVDVGSNGALHLGASSAETYSVAVEVEDAQGHILPDVGGSTRVSGLNEHLQVDPREDVLRLAERRVAQGMRYELRVAVPPTGAEMEAAQAPDSALQPYLDAPAPPTAVQALLKQAPPKPFDRMQFLRNALYTKVVAAGAGNPVDLPVSRVVDMLDGKEASPYEIVAGEALLTRWAGVPSRIGYGYYDGAAIGGGRHEIRPRNGAAWLEAYFKGHGWVPILGVPQKAKGSTDNNNKKSNPLIQPSDEVNVVVFVPTRDRDALLYFQIVAYWIGVVLPWVVLGIVLLVIHPALAKLLRSRVRRRWARSHGPTARILVAYAAFRDLANDLTHGDPYATPLEFLQYVEDDSESEDLAWLVTRTAWGDMARDVSDEDAGYAEELSASLRHRLLRAQNVVNLASAAVARTSLWEPYSDEIPRLWPRQRRRLRRFLRLPRPRAVLRGLRTAPRLLRLRRSGAIVSLFLLMALLTGCADSSGFSPDFTGPARLPAKLTPPSLGALMLVRNQASEAAYLRKDFSKLVTRGEVWLVKRGTVIEGSVQVSLLDRDVRAEDPVVFAGLDQNLGGPAFAEATVAIDQVVWVKELTDLRIYMWFPPRANAIELVVLRKKFAQHLQLVRSLVDYQHGRVPAPVVVPTPTPQAETTTVGGA